MPEANKSSLKPATRNAPPQTQSLVRTGGRKKGVPNKVTMRAREAFAQLIEAAVPRMAGWLVDIEKEHGSLVAFRCLADIAEFHVPKLSRQETVGDGGGPVTVVVHREA